MTETVDPVTVAFFCLAVSVLLSLWVLRGKGEGGNGSTSNVPNAVGGVPLLGNALQYKEDPTGCIRDQEKLTNSKMFRINLAGRKMIIVGSDPAAMKHIANQTESVMSSCRAVAETGFEYTLGSFNVYAGTAFHKKILKNYIMGEKFGTTFLPGIFKALSNAIDQETRQYPSREIKGECVEIPDLFHFVRRSVTRAILDSLVSPLLLKNDPGLLVELMVFQDKVENSTAKAAVLPHWLALPSCLWSTEKARKVVQQRIGKLLPTIWKDEKNELGPWLKAYVSENTPAERAAEHLIGLIFAAHKNPAIGASQSLCFLRNEITVEQQSQATKEATKLCSTFAAGNSCPIEALLEAKILRACVLETARVTAHTLGAVRYVEKDFEVESAASLVIQRGETIAMAHHSMHMETSLWGEDAAQFSLDRPEWKNEAVSRSTTSKKQQHDLGVPVDPYKFTTFSNGVHKCPGEKVALAIMELCLALLLKRDARFVGALPPVSFERATLAQREGPCAVMLKQSKE